MNNEKTDLRPIGGQRNYGIDALRIVSMLMVVTLHVLMKGGVLEGSNSLTSQIAWFIEIAAYCSVNCYALISGYVGVYSKYKISNLAVLWCRVVFYTVPITLAFRFLIPGSVSNKNLISSFFPIFTEQYWYFTSYAVLFLFIPILNEGLKRLSKRTLRFILISIVIAFFLERAIIKPFWGDVFDLDDGYSAWWLMVLYLIGGYIRKYGLFRKIKAHRSILFSALFLASVTITWLSKLVIQTVLKNPSGAVHYDRLLIQYQSVTILAAAVFLLLAFENINFHSAIIKIVAFLSPLAFSVYLIHENKLLSARFIMDKFAWLADMPAYIMIPLLLGIVIGIYLLCTAIDLIRHYLFKALKLKERFERLELRIRKKASRNA